MNVSRTGKRLLALTLCLVTVLALCAPALAANYVSVGTVSGNATIYTSNNTTSAALATVKSGAKVAIDGQSGNFYRVVLDPNAAIAAHGWIAKSSISKLTSVTSKNTATAVVDTSTAASSTTGTAGYITNCNSYVNFRATASASGSKLGTLSKNTAVTILSGPTNGFYQVQANGKTGYVSSAYVATGTVSSGSTSSTTTSSTSGTAGYITNCNSYVNFRSGASASSSKLGTLNKNTVVTILGTSGSFTKVEANGKTGYVSSEYVKAGAPGSSSTVATPSTSSGSGVAYGTLRVTADPSYSKLSSSVRKLLNSAQSKYSDAVGYIYSPGGLISQPIRYDKGLKLLTNSYNYVSSFYNTMTRNIVVTAHNNRKSSSNMMFHYLHHYQEKALNYPKCQSSTCGRSLSSVKDLNTSSNRTWEIPMFGYSKWELWAMYETQESEPKSTINYNTQHLSNASASAIQTWINYQLSRANASGSQGKVFNSSVKTSDVFLTLYTCGDEYDSSTAQSRLYFFFRAVA